MSSVQERIAALREEKENLDFRIEELERVARAEEEMEARRADFQHKEDQENIARLREQYLVTSNPTLVKILDVLVQHCSTPHMGNRPWLRCESNEIRMCNVTNGICLPESCRGTWSGGIPYVSGFFSYNSSAMFEREISYPIHTMIDFGLVYRNGIEGRRKGLVMKERKLLQLLPEKRLFDSLNAWIEEMGQPTFGVVKVCVYDPRTRHQKAQEALDAMKGSFEQKISWLMQQYKLKQVLNVKYSPKQHYERAVKYCENAKAKLKNDVPLINMDAPGGLERLVSSVNWFKSTERYANRKRLQLDQLSLEAQNKQPMRIINRWMSRLSIKDPVIGTSIITTSCNSVYMQVSRKEARVFNPQGPTQVFLWWRRQIIAFTV
jgi:hypothetical protein